MTEHDRLSAIGDGWDIRIAKRICEQLPDRSPSDEFEVHSLYTSMAYNLEDLTPEEKEWLPDIAQLDTDELTDLAMSMTGKEDHIFRLYATAQLKEHECHFTARLTEDFAIIDSGSSAHVSKNVKVTDPNSVIQR